MAEIQEDCQRLANVETGEKETPPGEKETPLGEKATKLAKKLFLLAKKNLFIISIHWSGRGTGVYKLTSIFHFGMTPTAEKEIQRIF